MELLITALIVGFVVYGLERNNARQTTPHPHLAGTTDIQDRDQERINTELLGRA